MSDYTWAAFILADAVTILAVVVSVLGIWESERDAESPRFTYKRAVRIWAAAVASWAVLGVARGVADHQWAEAGVLVATALFMTWVIAPSKEKTS